jgi:hypothetical protein
VVRQPERFSEAARGVGVRGAAQAALQVLNATCAQPSPFGQLFLRQSGRNPMPPEQLPEAARLGSAHRLTLRPDQR